MGISPGSHKVGFVPVGFCDLFKGVVVIHKIKSPKDLPIKPLKLMIGDVERIQKLYPDKNIWHFTTTYGWSIVALEI